MALDPLTAVLDVGGKLIDRLWPNKADADAAKLKLFELQQSGDLAQLAASVDLAKGQMNINEAEAGNSSLFVSGWRPGVGWVCAAAFAWQFVVAPALTFGFTVAGHVLALPSFESESLLTVLFGMLGMGGLRTFERIKGVIPQGR